ncbi:TetR/AcrR family transcriptional regulator [Dactylosporangium sp. CA-139066]|uniref:TetR/AcrR family transcriptional regulator n=1 Tax=Dactylosporangium sp. CA-139066 TaxID=3239930 RepID=UPI003D8A66BF
MTKGLRERRKEATRLAIAAAAMALFEVEGFDKVTIPQIAAAAGVSKMTVTNYFPRKEDLVFDHAEATINSLAEAVITRPRGETPLAALRRDYATRLAAGDVTLGPPTESFARLVHSSHSLTARGRDITDRREQALADALASESTANDPYPRIVAAQLASIHRVLFEYSVTLLLRGAKPPAIRRSLSTAAEKAFTALEPSLGTYARRP